MSCQRKKQLATATETVSVNTRGDWSTQEAKSKDIKLYSSDRPHIYYMAVMDCNNNFNKQYSANPINTPRVLIEWTMLNDNQNHFSYEDMGSLTLSQWLLFTQLAFFLFLARSYFKELSQVDGRYLSPHSLMMFSLFLQIIAQSLQTLHLWFFSTDGEGLLVLQILSKIASATSEVFMSILLILIMQGWTLTF